MLLIQQIKEKLLEISSIENHLKEAIFSFNNQEIKVENILFNYALKLPIQITYQDKDGTYFFTLYDDNKNPTEFFKTIFRNQQFYDLYYQHKLISMYIFKLYQRLEDEIACFSEVKALSFFNIMKKRDYYINNIPEDKKDLKDSFFMFRPAYYFDFESLTLDTIPLLEEFFNFDTKFIRFEIVNIKIKNRTKNKMSFYMSSSRYLENFNFISKLPITTHYTSKKYVMSKCNTFFVLDENTCKHIPEEFHLLFNLNNF